MTFSPGPASFIRGPKSASPSNTRGGSRVPEWGPLGSVWGALSNERPYRDLRNVVANYPSESSRGFPGSEPNSGHGDHTRLSCSAGDKQLGAGFCGDLQQRSAPTLPPPPSIAISSSRSRPGTVYRRFTHGVTSSWPVVSCPTGSTPS